MEITVLTLFPKFFENFVESSIVGRAIKENIVSVKIENLRDYTSLKNNQVDDYSFGGKKGMVIMCEPIFNALSKIDPQHAYHRVYLSPQGNVLNQKKALSISKYKKILILCGHYEGIDERALEWFDEEISIGDYVLTGGEVASLVLMDAIIRLVPNVIATESVENDSFSEDNLLDYPHYTKPRIFQGHEVPPVLLSGNHAQIDEWRNEQSVLNTFNKRKDLWEKIKDKPKYQQIIKKHKGDSNEK
ncbi:hypothetical protein ASO20_00635 [Mycoplasma sp. (ex Biomphalaria glabrata)]|nr:hypothetical protein ASO20_00635 [Mycoplasma sp. (ex Biomphalaria glabrata)]